MRISKYLHSCLLVEKATDKILFDPGKFSFVEGAVTPEQFRGLSAIIITHYHPDHVDEDVLKKILDNNPSVVVLTNAQAQEQLAQKGITADVFEMGEHAIGGFTLAAFDAPHAPLLDSPAPQNTAYLVDKLFLNPGDSFAETLDHLTKTPMLALPIMAPWTTELDVAAFADRLSPQQIIPVHDGYAKDFFLEQRYQNFNKHFSQQDVRFHAMATPGDSVEIGN